MPMNGIRPQAFDFLKSKGPGCDLPTIAAA
jgi:hypothetical protein